MRIGVSCRGGLKLLLALVAVCATWALAMAAGEDLGTVSGKVSAPKAFRAAQVYLRNIDKHTLYMVYTADGRYEATNLIPGNYEVSLKKDGFTTEVKKLQVKTGANLTADFALQEGSYTPAQLTVFNGPAGARPAPVQVAYNELYPPGPGKAVVERTCVSCHGPNFLPRRQWTQESATAAINLMTKGGVNTERGTGMITPEMLSPQDGELALSYIVANFGKDKPTRSVKVEEYPLDEKVLGRAMYIEYYVPLDPPAATPSGQQGGGGPFGRGRRLQEPRFDLEGNVWYTDRGVPNRIGKVDPRTAEFKDYPLPVPTADPHGLTVDMQGNVFWAETNGFHLGRLDPKTGQMTRYDMNVDGKSKGSLGHTPNPDSKGNIWFTVIVGNKIGRWDKAAQKVVALYEPPTKNSYPYGTFIDKNDKIWFFEYAGCKVGRFDPFTEQFTEWPALTKPCQIRRGGMDSKGNVWFGIYSHGKLGKLDPATGKVVEYKIPLNYAQPYDAWADPEDNIWMGDDGQGGTLIKFDPKTEKFTYYPAPQLGDMPKLAVSRDGSIWYTPRSAANAAVGVLHLDKTKIKTLAAFRRDPSRDN